MSIWAGPVRRICVSSNSGRRKRSDGAKEIPMSKFLYIYTGGQTADTTAAREEASQAWGEWFSTLGTSIADMGNPVGDAATVSTDGITDGAVTPARGYTVVSADSLGDAAAMAKGCPLLGRGGAVQVYEVIPM
jgi:hypothetical protein